MSAIGPRSPVIAQVHLIDECGAAGVRRLVSSANRAIRFPVGRMERAARRDLVRGEGPPDSRHVGLIGGLGVGATVIYHRAIAAGLADGGAVPRITIVHAHAPTALAHVTAGRVEELADHLAGFVAELRSVGAELIAICAVTPHIALGPLTKRTLVPVVDMLEATAQGLHERGFSRIALFGTRFTIETELFGALDAFDVIPPRPHEIDEIHRVDMELATAGHTSAANIEALREIARAVRRRDRVDAVVLAGTYLNLIFDEASAGFPAFDCASAHISTILNRATPG
jgi:aspartate racemase